MKNIIIILAGILIGSGSTLFIQHLKISEKITILNEINGVDFGGMKVKDLSTDALWISDMEGFILTVASKKNPGMGIMIDSVLEEDEDQGVMSHISLMDESGVSASFTDRNGDGIWNDIDFSKDGVTYGYGRLNGFPDMIMDDNGMKVRIGKDYFVHKNIDGKHYIETDGELVEVEYTHHYQFNIK